MEFVAGTRQQDRQQGPRGDREDERFPVHPKYVCVPITEYRGRSGSVDRRLVEALEQRLRAPENDHGSGKYQAPASHGCRAPRSWRGKHRVRTDDLRLGKAPRVICTAMQRESTRRNLSRRPALLARRLCLPMQRTLARRDVQTAGGPTAAFGGIVSPRLASAPRRYTKQAPFTKHPPRRPVGKRGRNARGLVLAPSPV